MYLVIANHFFFRPARIGDFLLMFVILNAVHIRTLCVLLISSNLPNQITMHGAIHLKISRDWWGANSF